MSDFGEKFEHRGHTVQLDRAVNGRERRYRDLYGAALLPWPHSDSLPPFSCKDANFYSSRPRESQNALGPDQHHGFDETFRPSFTL